MSKLYDVAVVGGHGLVSKSIIKDLYKYNFPLRNLVVYGSKEHANMDLNIDGREFKIKVLVDENIEKFDVVFFSTGEDLSYKYAEKFISLGARVIDNSSYYRMFKEVPLVIPEINEEDLLNNSKIYANPNCTTIMILLALYAIHKEFELEKIYISSYQSVSGAGSLALQEFINESIDPTFMPQYLPSKNATKKQMYNNILPIVDMIHEDGYTSEENKIEQESKKILHLPNLEVNPTTVRVPVLFGHGASISALCKKKIDLNKINSLLMNQDYLRVKTGNNYPDLKSVVGTHYVDVGRLRIDRNCEYTINLFATSDNLIRGASYNAVKIALSLIRLNII